MRSKSPLRLAIFLPVLILLLGVSIYFYLRKTITLSIAGDSRSLTTYALTVGNLLAEQNIHLSSQDELSPSVEDWLKNGDRITLQRAVPVQIFAGGKLLSLYSPDRIPVDLLSEAGVSLQPGDQVLSNGRLIDINQSLSAGIGSITLQVLPSLTLSLTQAGQTERFTSNASTLGSALWAAGLQFYAADQLEPPPQTPLVDGLSARLLRSRPVVIQVQDERISFRTAALTVGGALSDANLSLQGLDYSLPLPDAPLPPSGIVQVVHVTEEVLIEQAPLPFETQYQPVDDLELDSQSIVQSGEYGITAQRVRVRYENGQEVSRQAEGEWVARQPLTRILGYGTLVTMQTEIVDGVEIQYWRKLDMYATSYHPSEVGGTTASGLPLQKGVAAVDRYLIPFYTQMYVPGYGEVIAADTGGGVVGRWIDLGYSDNDYVPWHQWVTVYFLWPPPATIVWSIP